MQGALYVLTQECFGKGDHVTITRDLYIADFLQTRIRPGVAVGGRAVRCAVIFYVGQCVIRLRDILQKRD